MGQTNEFAASLLIARQAASIYKSGGFLMPSRRSSKPLLRPPGQHEATGQPIMI
jgi:hypothetical protein